jgi:hypothetical protein
MNSGGLSPTQRAGLEPSRTYAGVPGMPSMGRFWLATAGNFLGVLLNAVAWAIPEGGVIPTWVHILGLVWFTLMCIVQMKIGYPDLLEKREANRKLRWEVWLNRELPRPDPPVNWEEFSDRIESELKDNNWKQIGEWKFLDTIKMCQSWAEPEDEEISLDEAFGELDEKILGVSRIPPVMQGDCCCYCGKPIMSARQGYCGACEDKEFQKRKAAEAEYRKRADEALKLKAAKDRLFESGHCEHEFLRDVTPTETYQTDQVHGEIIVATGRPKFVCECCNMKGEVQRSGNVTEFVTFPAQTDATGKWHKYPTSRILGIESGAGFLPEPADRPRILPF